jgi:hypothetical protein
MPKYSWVVNVLYYMRLGYRISDELSRKGGRDAKPENGYNSEQNVVSLPRAVQLSLSAILLRIHLLQRSLLDLLVFALPSASQKVEYQLRMPGVRRPPLISEY